MITITRYVHNNVLEGPLIEWQERVCTDEYDVVVDVLVDEQSGDVHDAGCPEGAYEAGVCVLMTHEDLRGRDDAAACQRAGTVTAYLHSKNVQ